MKNVSSCRASNGNYISIFIEKDVHVVSTTNKRKKIATYPKKFADNYDAVLIKL